MPWIEPLDEQSAPEVYRRPQVPGRVSGTEDEWDAMLDALAGESGRYITGTTLVMLAC